MSHRYRVTVFCTLAFGVFPQTLGGVWVKVNGEQFCILRSGSASPAF